MNHFKFGIFLGYAPEQKISNQGLGRLLAFIIQGMVKKGGRVVLASPLWSKPQIMELLRDFDIAENQIEWILTNRVSFLIKLRAMLMKQAGRKTFWGKKIGMAFIRRLKNLYKKIFQMVVRSLSLPVVFSFIFLLLYVVFFLILLPLLMIIGIPLGIVAFLLRKKQKSVKKGSSVIQKFFDILIKAPLLHLKENQIAVSLYKEIRTHEFKILINKINRKKEVDAWLIPTLFWPEVQAIRAPKVIVVPDLVYIDFPVDFSRLIARKSVAQVEQSLYIGDHIICYSKYIKDHQLVRVFGIPKSKITVIPHANVDCGGDLQRGDHTKFSSRAFASEILRQHMQKAFEKNAYMRDLDLSCFPYFVYTSQIRPHKNVLNLIKAYRKLLREELMNVKLIFTGNILSKEFKKIRNYIKSETLELDVLFIPNVSAQALAALNYLALCSINPTLFEGGFPFTFSEAYSVGTPSIMGRIPMVMEMLPEDSGLENMLFDPYDIQDMCNRMKWAVENQEALLKLQTGLYQHFQHRTWENVAEEYQNVLERTAREFAHVYQK